MPHLPPAAAIRASLETLILALDAAPPFRQALGLVLAERFAQPGAAELPSARLPLLVCAALGGDPAAALPAAAACTAVYLGADLFDDLADGDLPAAWAAQPPSLVNLVATTFLAALPYRALAGLAPPLAGELSAAIAAALLEMSAGQYEDLTTSPETSASLEGCRRMVERKSGAEFGLFALAGAIAATPDPASREAAAAFGRCLGAASQIASDVADLWQPVSQDLLAGKRALPIIYAEQHLPPERRARFAEALAEARRGPEAHDEARRLLVEAGALRYAALIIGVYRQRALTQLARLGSSGAWRAELERLARAIALG